MGIISEIKSIEENEKTFIEKWNKSLQNKRIEINIEKFRLITKTINNCYQKRYSFRPVLPILNHFLYLPFFNYSSLLSLSSSHVFIFFFNFFFNLFYVILLIYLFVYFLFIYFIYYFLIYLFVIFLIIIIIIIINIIIIIYLLFRFKSYLIYLL